MGRLTLKQMIINKCEEERGLAVKLAELGCYSSGSALLKILKDDKKEFAKFYGLVKIVRHLFPDDEKELMAEYALTLDPNKSTARIMLEYLNVNGLIETRDVLIELMLNCGNGQSKEWASVYKIDMMYLNREIDFDKATKLYSALNLKNTETMVITELLKSYCYLDQHEYNMIKRSMDLIKDDFEEIKDEYLKEILYCRHAILLVGYYVRNNKSMMVRDICWSMIDQVDDEYFKCFAFLHLGNSYIIEDYNVSYSLLKSGYELSKGKHGKINFALRSSICFVSNLWKKDTMLIDVNSKEVSDIHEVAFYYIQHGQKEMAKKELDKVNFEELSVNQKAFNCYYNGLLENSMDLLSKSIVYFKKSGDYFFRQLPLLELSKMNVPQCIVEALAE
jgi:hypothetical protein